MDCARAEELLSDDADGLLADPLRSDLDGHIAGCAQCRALRAALRDVIGALQNPPELAAPDGLVDRVLAGLARERIAPPGPAAAARPRLSVRRLQAIAAAVAIAGTSVLYASREPALKQGARLAKRASNAGVYLLERKERLMEDVRILRVVVSAAFEGRVDRVNDRVEDYRRLLERRRAGSAPEQKKSEDRSEVGPHARAGGLDFSPNRREQKLVKQFCG